MRRMVVFGTVVLLCGQALARECVIRVGYPDRERPPYYLGNGATVPEPAGAGVDLLREAVRSAGCKAELVRLPTARLKFALIDSTIDLAPVDLRDGEKPFSALPKTSQGGPDKRRGMPVTAVVYVRAADAIPSGINPRAYFKHHALAINQGSPLSEQLRDEGYNIDSGTADAYSNMDKVMIKRVDGFAISTANEDALDSAVTARYGDGLVRLGKPMRSSTVWLSASNPYYRNNPRRMEQLWDWWGDNAARRLTEFVKDYPAPK